jgi:nitrogen-specific signal transduction histidine kinase
MVQCNLRDVTAAKFLQRELLQAQKLESMGSLAGGIAHDFNNILTIISSYLESLRRGAESGKREDAVAAMQTAVERGAALVRQLLAFARRSEGEAPVPVDVTAVVGELFTMIRETFPKQITIEQDLAPGLPKVVADPNQLHQAMLNLCVNARDAMPDGGKLSIRTAAVGRETVAARFPKAGDDAYVSITVSDEGHGLDEATRARIFEPFFTTKKDHGGSGLGLAVAYGIVKVHRGFIDARDNAEKGTCFEIFLPAAPPADGTGSPRKAKEDSKRKTRTDAPPSGAAARTVLVVEDESLLRTSLKEFIEAEGYRVFTAPDGLEALRLYREHQGIGVVVSDLQMPKLGGWETFLRLRESDPAARVILLSGYFDGRRRTEMMKAGVAECISKPFQPAAVIDAIRRVLAREA